MRTFFLLGALFAMLAAPVFGFYSGGGGGEHGSSEVAFPPALSDYGDDGLHGLGEVLLHRLKVQPFNGMATLIFFLAILHTFMANRITRLSHDLEHRHKEAIKQNRAMPNSVSFSAEMCHFLGEVEAVFGIWAVALFGAIIWYFDWNTVVSYTHYKVNFTEPIFVVVIMTFAASRPILKLAEGLMARVSGFFGGSLVAWWLTILTLGPLLGSFITEPAAMTICALLLVQKFYVLDPSIKFKYATMGLLFVNISVGGTLSHFAAPPILMVASSWNWSFGFVLTHIGWKAIIGIGLSNVLYFLYFKKDLAQLAKVFDLHKLKAELVVKYVDRRHLELALKGIGHKLGHDLQFVDAFEREVAITKSLLWDSIVNKVDQDVDLHLLKDAFCQRFEEIKELESAKGFSALRDGKTILRFQDPNWNDRDGKVPATMMLVHVLFMAWTVFNAHQPALMVGGLLFFLGFAQATCHFQNRIDLKPPLLVGFFLAGLVIHGGVQAWWIAPVLGKLGELPLMLGATVLTAFNDNAAITYLSTLVPGFTEQLKYAVVTGAVSGGGLTVIANAPNPAGQSILKPYFPDGVSPLQLFLAAFLPTVLMILCFLLL